MEMILVCGISALIVSATVPILKVLKNMQEIDSYNYQDDIGIYQLQIKLATSNIDEVGPDNILLHDQDNDYEISEVNGNLICTPGFLLYLHDIDSIDFQQQDDILVLSYCRNNQCSQWPVAYYLDFNKPEDEETKKPEN